MANVEEYINKLIEGDCLKVLRTFPDNCIDMVLCDLPYGQTHNSWDKTIDLEQLWVQYRRIIKKGAVVLLTGSGLFTAKLILSNSKMFRYKIVWIKSRVTNFLNVQRQPLRKHEDICVFYEGSPVYHPQLSSGKPYERGLRGQSDNYNAYRSSRCHNVTGQRYPADVVFFEEEHLEDHVYIKTAETEGECYHPTQKPVELGRYLIRTYSNPGDIVLDNCAGSGSFLVSALLEDRRYIGIEKNKIKLRTNRKFTDYIQICNTRIVQAIRERQSKIHFDE
ncbi:MAG TPA: site-specific DNA-methyltransferase [Agriterribacter sp.]|jgi:DNA modification methylase|nr:site-specific DNA-methyltransferase [Agriterribacter sp.]